MRPLAFALLLLLPLAPGARAQAPFASFDGASAAVLNDPHDLAFGPDGRLYVADKFAGRIAIFDPDTLELVGSFGDGRLAGVHDISFGADGRAYVAVTGLSAVAVFDLSSGEPEPGELFTGLPRTEGVLAHSNGRIYATAGGAGVLVAIEDGQVVAAAEGLGGAHDVEEGADGSVWVADNFRGRLVQYSADLERLRVLDAPELGLVGPRYLAVDDFGRLLVADQDAHRVVMIDPLTGALLGAIGDGTPGLGPGKLDDPEGVAVRGSRYFFADSDNNRIVRYVVVIN